MTDMGASVELRERLARAMFTAEPWSSFWSEEDAQKLVNVILATLTPADLALLAKAYGLAVISEDYANIVDEAAYRLAKLDARANRYRETLKKIAKENHDAIACQNIARAAL